MKCIGVRRGIGFREIEGGRMDARVEKNVYDSASVYVYTMVREMLMLYD